MKIKAETELKNVQDTVIAPSNVQDAVIPPSNIQDTVIAPSVGILSAEKLVEDIQQYITEAEETQLERSTKIAMDESMSKEQKRLKMADIWAEKYSVQAILNNLKSIATFNGRQYELPKRQVATRTPGTSVGSTAHTGRFQIGDLLHYLQDGTASETYEVVETGLKNVQGIVITSSKATLQAKLALMGKTEQEFRTEYFTGNGREFKGFPGLSDPHWVKIIN
jgi:hypothetical protein